MSATLIIVVLLVTMIALVGVMVTLSIHANQVRQATPLREAIGALDQRLLDRRTTLDELNAEIGQRTQDRDRLAQLTTDVAVIREQRDSLLAEMSNIGAQREELAAIERERADLVLGLAETIRQCKEAEAELSVRRDEIERIKGQLAAFEATKSRVEDLVQQRNDLEGQVGDLRALRADADRLRGEVEEALSRSARLQSAIETDETRLEDLRRRLQNEVIGHEAAQASHAELRLELAAGRQSLSDVRGEVALLEARWARIEAEAERLALSSAEETARLDEARRGGAAARAETESTRDDLAAIKAELTGARQDLAEAREDVTILGARKAQIEAALAGISGAPGRADDLEDLRKEPPLLSYLRRDSSRPDLQEAEALQQVEVHLRSVGLEYHPRTVSAFHTALKVIDNTQMTVLAGISGTGKSQLPRRYAEAMGLGFLPVPVQPRWDSPQDLMGFYNYIEGRY